MLEKSVLCFRTAPKSCRPGRQYFFHLHTSAQKSYLTFCETHNLQALPADEMVILLYIAYLSPRGSSLNVYLAAIHHLHVLYGHNYQSLSSPRDKLDIKGITDICPSPSQKLPITFDMLV